jgi:hypothetical protein
VETKTDFLSNLLTKSGIGMAASINDLRDKEFSGAKLNPDERAALSNFDRYRLNVLNSETNEEVFHYKYRQLQVIANLSDWKEFLHENFFQ